MKLFRATVGMNFPTDIKVLQRIAAGEDVYPEERNEVRYEEGDIIEENKIPASILVDLLSQNYLILVDTKKEVSIKIEVPIKEDIND